NNLVGQASPAIATVGDDGFDLANITYATSVSGNSIYAAADDGIVMDNSSLSPSDAANAVTIVSNTVSGVAGDGIDASFFRTITIQTNPIGLVGYGTGQHCILVSDTSGVVTIGGSSTAEGNSVYRSGCNGIHVVFTGVSSGPGG